MQRLYTAVVLRQILGQENVPVAAGVRRGVVFVLFILRRNL